MSVYFSTLNSINIMKHHDKIKKIEEEAILHNIPIISKEGLALLLFLTTHSKKFLEIGSAVAYTAINVALHNEKIIVDTIERDKDMYQKALINISQLNLSHRINVYNYDALDIDLGLLSTNYDVIFIDAAKAQYQKFFLKFEPLLSNQGLFVCDNLLFHGLVENPSQIQSKNLRSLVSKIDSFNKWLAENPNYVTIFLEIGDGMAVSIKK